MLRLSLYILVYVMLSISSIFYADSLTINIDIKDHKFVPNIISVPSGQKFYLQITNLDDSAEEFDSMELYREKIIPPNSVVKMAFSPLKIGEYRFFGEFHPESAYGKIIVR